MDTNVRQIATQPILNRQLAHNRNGVLINATFTLPAALHVISTVAATASQFDPVPS
jgi:hypothetical protein